MPAGGLDNRISPDKRALKPSLPVTRRRSNAWLYEGFFHAFAYFVRPHAQADRAMKLPYAKTAAKTTATALASVAMTGCTRSPSLNVLGAYFPDWMFCMVAAAVLTVAVHVCAQRASRDRWFGPPALVYPGMFALFALVLWLIFFQH